MNGRICPCGCGASLAGMRADAVYASEACEKRFKRRTSTDKAPTRRRSRDGSGIRIYVTFADLFRLLEVAPSRTNTRAKLDRAYERLVLKMRAAR